MEALMGRSPTVRNAPQTGQRNARRPRHDWFVRFKPHQYQPVFCVPVGAGDSLKKLRFEARVLTDPLIGQVSGWWAELFVFYVRMSTLDEADAARRLVTTRDDNLDGLITAAQSPNWTFHSGDGPDWLFMASKPILRTYFRRDDEDWNAVTIDGVPSVAVHGKTWMDALVPTASISGDLETSDDYEARWEAYQDMRKQGLPDLSFPEFLRSQGIAVPDQLDEPVEQFRRPELIRFVRQFTYPANTINPSSAGQQVSAASWVLAERLDRPIFCDEPGFLVGVQVVRPKWYRTGQTGHASAYLRDARSWIPQELLDAPQESLLTYVSDTPGTNPVAGGSLDVDYDYTVDANGIFVLGDTFMRDTTGFAPELALPATGDSDLNCIYPDLTSVNALFAVQPDNGGDGLRSVMSDGTCTLTLTGRRAIGIKT